jgi:serine/threonine protein kinase
MHCASRKRPDPTEPRPGERSLNPTRHASASSRCLTEEQILDFVSARLDQREVALVDAHLRHCPACEALAIEALYVCRDRDVKSQCSNARCVAFEPDTCVGQRFVIRRFIGRGGMGDVYEAFDRQLEQTVALKMARATVCDDPESTARLNLEVKLARRVSHPNICRVYDVGMHHDARPHDARTGFVSMEYIEGESLAQRLELGRLPLETFGHVAREMLIGVSAIHGAGLIHRDIKSHNIMLRKKHRPSSLAIIDFGLAVDIQQRMRQPSSSGDRVVAVEGSPAYMAPEQFDSIISPGSDLFACGVVLFEALTGRLPFRDIGPERRQGARRDPREVPLRAATLATHVPDALDAVLAHCLALDPDQRYGDARQVLRDLEGALAH